MVIIWGPKSVYYLFRLGSKGQLLLLCYPSPTFLVKQWIFGIDVFLAIRVSITSGTNIYNFSSKYARKRWMKVTKIQDWCMVYKKNATKILTFHSTWEIILTGKDCDVFKWS